MVEFRGCWYTVVDITLTIYVSVDQNIWATLSMFYSPLNAPRRKHMFYLLIRICRNSPWKRWIFSLLNVSHPTWGLRCPLWLLQFDLQKAGFDYHCGNEVRLLKSFFWNQMWLLQTLKAAMWVLQNSMFVCFSPLRKARWKVYDFTAVCFSRIGRHHI